MTPDNRHCYTKSATSPVAMVTPCIVSITSPNNGELNLHYSITDKAVHGAVPSILLMTF